MLKGKKCFSFTFMPDLASFRLCRVEWIFFVLREILFLHLKDLFTLKYRAHTFHSNIHFSNCFPMGQFLVPRMSHMHTLNRSVSLLNYTPYQLLHLNLILIVFYVMLCCFFLNWTDSFSKEIANLMNFLRNKFNFFLVFFFSFLLIGCVQFAFFPKKIFFRFSFRCMFSCSVAFALDGEMNSKNLHLLREADANTKLWTVLNSMFARAPLISICTSSYIRVRDIDYNSNTFHSIKLIFLLLFYKGFSCLIFVINTHKYDIRYIKLFLLFMYMN